MKIETKHVKVSYGNNRSISNMNGYALLLPKHEIKKTL